MDQAQYNEVLRAARDAGLEGAGLLRDQLQRDLGTLQAQLQQVRADQIHAASGADPDAALLARLDDIERQLHAAAGPPADGGVPRALFAGRPLRPPRVDG